MAADALTKELKSRKASELWLAAAVEEDEPKEEKKPAAEETPAEETPAEETPAAE